MNPDHERMAAIVRGCAEEAGLFCLEAKVNPRKRQSMIVAVVDSAEGVTLDQCATLSREIARRIDEEFPDELYELHVGSPGTDRVLEFDWQFAKNTGRLLRFFVDHDDARRSLELRLVGIEGRTIRCTNRDGAVEEYDIGAITHAVVVPEIGGGRKQ